MIPSVDDVDPRRFVTILTVGLVVLTVAATPAAAAAAEDELRNQFQSISDLLILIIGLVAVPNGAFGILQWMTAGANEEKLQKGKTRIRNTFIALGGAAVIKVAVTLVQTTLFP